MIQLGIALFEVTTAIADTAVGLSATYNVKTPDAIQLATAIDIGADYFLTNDAKLKMVVEVTVVTLDEIQI